MPLLATKGFSLRVKGRLPEACIRTAILHRSETWSLNAENERRLERNKASMYNVSDAFDMVQVF